MLLITGNSLDNAVAADGSCFIPISLKKLLNLGSIFLIIKESNR